MKNDIVIYSKETCPYCKLAQDLLDRKDVSYTLIDITGDPARVAEMIEKSGGRKTVPQIFINGTYIGGFDDLEQLEDEGKLDKFLSANSQ